MPVESQPTTKTDASPGESPAARSVARAPWNTYGLLLLTTIIWGGTNVVAKLTLGIAPVAGLAAARFAIAALGFSLLLLLTEPAAFRIKWRDVPLLLGLGITGITLSNLLFFYGLSLAPVTDAALVSPATAPLWTALFAALILGERYSRRQLLGIGVSLVGVVLIVGAAGFETTTSSDRLLGNLILIIGSGCWGIYSALGRIALRRFSPLAASTLASLFGVVPMIALAIPDGIDWLITAPLPLWLGLLYLALLGTVAAFLTWYRGIRDLGAGRAGQFTYLAPLWSLLLAAVLLGDRPAPLQLAGAGLVLAGIVLTNTGLHRRAPGPT